MRQAVIVVACVIGCSQVSVEDPRRAAAGGQTSTTSSAASGGGGTGGGQGATGAGGEAVASGSGRAGSGGGPACGDATLDADEECDDGNVVGGDGCGADCVVECDPFDPMNVDHEGVWKDPLTHHCYRWAGGLVPLCSGATFAQAEADCGTWGGDVTALSTLDELDAVVASGVVSQNALDVLLGGRDLTGQGDWTWSNGEPWTYVSGSPPWQASEPVGGAFLEMYCCPGSFNADGDGSACGWMCERKPAGR